MNDCPKMTGTAAGGNRAARRPTALGGTSAAGLTCMMLILFSAVLPAGAQPPKHPRHSIDMVPGAVGRDQLTRGGPLRGYFQPVQIVGPAGSSISMVVDGRFDGPQPSPVTVGLLIGEVYRFKVTGIPQNEGMEVFPTIELVNRLFPPRGEQTRFPIPVHVTQEELEMALDGRYVTRVVYLEDPATALPRREVPGFQRYFDVLASQDPLQVADQLGRPMAILRMGSRVPDTLATSRKFVFGSPPLIKYPTPGRKPVLGELKSVVPRAGQAPSPRGAPAATPSVRGDPAALPSFNRDPTGSAPGQPPSPSGAPPHDSASCTTTTKRSRSRQTSAAQGLDSARSRAAPATAPDARRKTRNRQPGERETGANPRKTHRLPAEPTAMGKQSPKFLGRFITFSKINPFLQRASP